VYQISTTGHSIKLAQDGIKKQAQNNFGPAFSAI